MMETLVVVVGITTANHNSERSTINLKSTTLGNFTMELDKKGNTSTREKAVKEMKLTKKLKRNKVITT